MLLEDLVDFLFDREASSGSGDDDEDEGAKAQGNFDGRKSKSKSERPDDAIRRLVISVFVGFAAVLLLLGALLG